MICVGGFLLVMLGLALSFAGWLDDVSNTIYSGWCLLLIWNYIGIYLLAANDRGRCDTFYAIGKIRPWCLSEMIVHIGFSFVFIALWSLLLATWDLSIGALLVHDTAMLVFSIVSAQAVFVSLQPRIFSLPESRRMALYAVISAPWNLTAWILGLFASKSLISGSSPWPFVIATALLGGFQCLLSFKDESNDR
ncbi:MAG: hypothetical protein IJU23_11825 [Proteobacteria bacterium]|nr:hypothetical protein [Pseudomonadota bacterium]